MSFSVVSLNARGLRDVVKRKALFLFSRQFGSDFVFLQESHSNDKDVNFWKSQWGNEIWFSHGSEHSAGVSCLKNNFTGDVLHTYCEYGHFILLLLKCYNVNLIVVNYYGYNSRSENDQLLFVLEDKLTYWQSKFPNAYLVIGGDFNTVLN